MKPFLYSMFGFLKGRSINAESVPTLREGLEKYLREVSPEKKGGAPQDASLVRTWLKTQYADWCMSRITGRELSSLRDEWLQQCKPATVIRRLAILSHLYTMATTEWQYRRLENPVKQIRKPKVRNGRTRRLYADIQLHGYPASELDWIVAASRSGQVRLSIMLAVETAMRRGEIAGLRRDDIDLENCTALVRDTKNGENRLVPLSPKALDLLRQYQSGNPKGRVFRCGPEALTRGFIRARRVARKRYAKECETQGVAPDLKYFTNLRFHDLRHEAISAMAPHFHAHELAKISGHKDTRMLMRYYHPNPTDLAVRLAAI